jgi:MATE family multidrug resistance protein
VIQDSRQELRRELRGVVSLAAPVVVVQLGTMLMGTVDTMMLGRVSEQALAAGALGHAVGTALVVLGIGVLMAMDPLAAQAFGAGDQDGMAAQLLRGTVLALVLALPISLALALIGGHLDLLGQQPELQELAGSYVRWLVPGVAPFLLFWVLRQFLQARSLVRPAVFAIVVANLFNVVADWALIFGHLGLPRLEVKGSAMATSSSRWVLFLALLFAAQPLLRPYWLRARRAAVTLRGLWQMLKIGIPVSVQVGLEFFVFTTVALMMGNLGARELAAHQIAINLASLSFMVPFGIAGAAATRVGNAIGRGDSEGARRSAAVSLIVGGGVMLIFGALFRLLPSSLARLYTNEPEVIALAALLIPIAGLFQVVDGTQVVGAGILRGAADTRFPALTAFIGFWLVGLPFGSWLTYGRGMGPQGLWWGLTAGLATVALLLVLRIRVRFRRDLAAVERV